MQSEKHTALVGKPKGKKPLERPRSRWVIILKLIIEKWQGIS
jgi:hypothetical protein